MTVAPGGQPSDSARLAIWAVLSGALVVLVAAGARQGRRWLASLPEIFRWLRSSRWRQGIAILVWAWLGWHLFVR